MSSFSTEFSYHTEMRAFSSHSKASPIESIRLSWIDVHDFFKTTAKCYTVYFAEITPTNSTQFFFQVIVIATIGITAVLQELPKLDSLPLEVSYRLIFLRWFHAHFNTLQKHKDTRASGLLTLRFVRVICGWEMQHAPGHINVYSTTTLKSLIIPHRPVRACSTKSGCVSFFTSVNHSPINKIEETLFFAAYVPI